MDDNITEWQLQDYMKKHRRWFTTKELILAFKIKINGTEMVKFNRKINSLLKFKRIEYRVCNRSIAWKHEFEYKYKGIKRCLK